MNQEVRKAQIAYDLSNSNNFEEVKRAKQRLRKAKLKASLESA